MAIGSSGNYRQLWVVWPIVAAATALSSMAWISSQTGVGWMGIGLALSVFIATPVSLTFLWLNRWHRGRRRLLVSAFIWGASVAAFCAIWSQEWLQALVDAVWGHEVGAWVRPLIITPVTEEGFKSLFLVWLLIYRRREITGVLDAVVYAGLVGIGFSFIENSLYFGRPLMELAQSGGHDAAAASALGATLAMRVFLVPFFHSLMVVLTGIGIGIAAGRNGRAARIWPVVAGLATAIALHGIWDWAGLASSDRYLIFKIYGSVMVPVFIAVLIICITLRGRQGRSIVAGLPEVVERGDITAEEAVSLSSLRARRKWRGKARRAAGRPAARAVARYQSEVSALAIRLRRGSTIDRDLLPEQRDVVATIRMAVDKRIPVGQ